MEHREMESSLPVRERVNRLRERRRQAGLMRVEVLVPQNQADAVKAYAAQLREGSQSERIEHVRKLIAKAYRKFHASCLDNVAVDAESADFPDAAVVAAALMHRGNAEAYKLGRQIQNLAK
jgi:hypothetical protein